MAETPQEPPRLTAERMTPGYLDGILRQAASLEYIAENAEGLSETQIRSLIFGAMFLKELCAEVRACWAALAEAQNAIAGLMHVHGARMEQDVVDAALAAFDARAAGAEPARKESLHTDDTETETKVHD